MSYDISVYRFVQGDAAPMPVAAFDSVFRRYIDRTEPDHNFWHLQTSDGGEADLYATVTDSTVGSLMVSRFSTGMVLDLLVEFARSAQAVIVAPDGSTMLTDEEQRHHVPDELRPDAVIVTSGSDVLAVLQSG